MLEVKNYFFDDEGNIWADIHSNGRRQRSAVIDRDGHPLLYDKFLELETNEHEKAIGRRILTDYCHQNGYEKYMAKLPHIEDTSKALQEAYESADEWDQPFSGCGYYENDEQFALEYGMTVDEYKEQMEADIKKYGLNEYIWDRNSDDDCLYGVTWWICEDFTKAVKEG